MARILYGIHGTGHGHAMRGLTIARRLGAHEFLFVANDDAPKILDTGTSRTMTTDHTTSSSM